MKLLQSKYENRSTSSSQYFKKRFGESQIYQEHGSSDKNIKLYAPSLISQGSKVMSQYEIFKPSQLIDKPQSYLKININETIQLQTKNQRKSPFLSSNYNIGYSKIKQDKIKENKLSKDTFGINSDKKLKQSISFNNKEQIYGIKNKQNYLNKGVDRQYYNSGRFENVRQMQEYVIGRPSSNSYKQNIKPSYSKSKNNINETNKSVTNIQLIQPITLLKSSCSHGNLLSLPQNRLLSPRTNNYSNNENNNYNTYFKSNNSNIKYTNTQHYSNQNINYNNQNNYNKYKNILPHIDQPYNILQHIHFTIAHQNNFTQVFKSFVNQQKNKLNNRFKQFILSIENTLNQIQIIFQNQIDSTYASLLYQLNSLKSMAQIMWKNKSNSNCNNQNQLKFSKILNIQQFQYNNAKNRYQSSNQNIIRGKSSSKYSYKKFSQYQNRSPDSNNYLLNQLEQQDRRLLQYKQTKRFYFNELENNINQIDRDKLLKDMYEASKKITRIMKQSQDIFYDKINLQGKQKHKAFVWFNSVTNYMNNNEGYNQNDRNYRYNKQQQEQNINKCLKQQINKLNSYIDTFRQNIKYKYTQNHQ